MQVRMTVFPTPEEFAVLQDTGKAGDATTMEGDTGLRRRGQRVLHRSVSVMP